MQLRHKVVLITGASEGIGAACARECRQHGAALSLTARSLDKLHGVAGDGDLVNAGDITSPDTRRHVIEATIERFGRIDILVNNAGAGLYRPAWLASDAEARALFELNFFAPLDMVRQAAPHMRRQQSGMVVNISSVAGKVTLPWFTLYSASKYAIGSLSDGLRMELQRDGIHVMTVCPGYVDTGFQSHIMGGSVPVEIARSRRFSITAPECARAIVRGIERDARTVVTPGSAWLLVAAARLLPSLVDAQLEKIYSRHVAAGTRGEA